MDSIIRWVFESKVIFKTIAVMFIIAGIFYILFPPNTTAGFFSGAWPSITWGIAMLLGGTIKLYGLRTKLLHYQVLGLAFMWVGSGSLALAQTMVMIDPPVSLTRGGGAAIYWTVMLLVVGRLLVVSADKRDGQDAQAQIDERR